MKLFLLIILLNSFIFSKEFRFSTLLTDRTVLLETEYSYLLNYLEENTPYKFKFIYSQNYEELVKMFKEDKIDILALDAIEYVKLKRYFPYVEAFMNFLNYKGENFYHCYAVTGDYSIKKLEQINNKTIIKLNKDISTCGFYIGKYLLSKYIPLNQLHYKEIDIHDNLILETLLEPKTLGFESSNFINQYKHFKFNLIKTDLKIPSFALIADTHILNKEEIKNIQNALIKLKPLENKEDKKITENWNINIKYGAVISNQRNYRDMYKVMHDIETSKEK